MSAATARPECAGRAGAAWPQVCSSGATTSHITTVESPRFSLIWPVQSSFRPPQRCASIHACPRRSIRIRLRASQHLRLCSLVTAECAVLKEACIPPAPPPSRPSQGALQRVVWEECKSQREEESCNTCSSRQDAAAALMSSQLPGNNRPKRREELPEKL